ncbi:uncharacterized protein MONBRDRAFT_7135 [Monosiga brevicollis MX1]|uniref:Uncharacterized protein n=1 Tax=Monosiga brevicollis TaxID=81824 RepID=A9UW15_MONBE|nr:uncharacterized protein MONBRDRAFT_7135 [Monosiga brevicollis MX1]EDQ90482.1 predicted protein [Monosiga brevicollis MX1]|eukprot:XP_001744533.1 hypothetical protein [Monosiga brevicollis MX1]
MEERVPEAQDFVAQTDEYSLQQDDVFRAFKKQDIEATLAAASTGKFSDYWTVERLVDLNNIVDADSRASSDIKSQLQRFAFAPDLPPDCQLRVRKGPDADSETIAVVTRDEEIFAVAELGDWIRVELPGQLPRHRGDRVTRGVYSCDCHEEDQAQGVQK